MDFHYLLDAESEGRIIVLKFYNAPTDEIVEKRYVDYKPYFFLPNPLSEADQEKVRSLYGDIEVVEKRDLFTDKTRKLSKVMVYSIDAFKKAAKLFENVWEAEIDYVQSYVFDHNLVFGAPYKIDADNLTPVADLSEELETSFQNVFAEGKAADPQKYLQIEHWFRLLHQPIPEVTLEKLGLEESSSENLHRAFALARIANIPVAKAHERHRVSDWLKPIIHNFLRRNNVLIPTSTELRRGMKTHRVPGALTVQPKAGVYFHTVVCDFESLYPSCIDSYNLSYETVNCPHEECGKNRISECPEQWVCTIRRGFYSILVGALKDLRIHWFKPLSQSTAVKEQERKKAKSISKLLKLISVSSYGVTVRIHGLACPPLAECITGYGRWALQTTWDLAEGRGLHPTYGDTDSLFLDNPRQDQVEWLIRAAKEKLRLDLAVEKEYSLCVLPEAKKAYFGILPDGKPDIKGLTAIKSNSPKIIQKIFQDCVKELSRVKTLEEYESAKKRMIAIVRQAERNLKNREVQLEDLIYSVKLYYDPSERTLSDVKMIPQPYQCATQLLDSGITLKKGDIAKFIKVKPFNYRGKTFTVKPAELVKSVDEINPEDYIRNMRTALKQTFAPMRIELERRVEAKISDWFER